jgi:tRNA (cmo5U34)-methyltransferase
MLARAQKKLSDAEKKHVTLTQHDLNTPILLKPADAIILNLTLQFLQRDARHALLTECYRSLQQRGVVLVIEKVCGQDDAETHTLSTRYEFYKQLNGYSLKEIENKKKALDHILNPLSIDENEHLFREAGFKTINQQFRWVNFVGWELQK